MNDRPPSTRGEIIIVFLTCLIFVTYVTSDYFLWKQSKVAERAANAAAAAANLAKQNMELSERAWVGATHSEKSRLVPNHDATFVITIKNVGRTPAFVTHSSAGRALVPAKLRFRPSFALTSLPKGGIASRVVLEPQMEITVKPPPLRRVPNAEIHAIKQGTLVLYVFGRVRYSDIFGGNHTTRYCVRLMPDLNFQACSVYNEAD